MNQKCKKLNLQGRKPLEIIVKQAPGMWGIASGIKKKKKKGQREDLVRNTDKRPQDCNSQIMC